MPTPTKGPRLGGGPAHERLMLANLATALFEHGKITTTEAKARSYCEAITRSIEGFGASVRLCDLLPNVTLDAEERSVSPH